MIGEVEMVGQDRWEEIHRPALIWSAALSGLRRGNSSVPRAAPRSSGQTTLRRWFCLAPRPA